MTVRCTCGAEGSHIDFHLDTLGDGESWVCDGCYYARQPWHNDGGIDGGVTGLDTD